MDVVLPRQVVDVPDAGVVLLGRVSVEPGSVQVALTVVRGHNPSQLAVVGDVERLVRREDDDAAGILAPANLATTNHYLERRKDLTLLFSEIIFAFVRINTCTRPSKPPSGLSMLPEMGASWTLLENWAALGPKSIWC